MAGMIWPDRGGSSTVISDPGYQGAFVDLSGLTAAVPAPSIGDWGRVGGIRYDWTGAQWISSATVVSKQTLASPGIPSPHVNGNVVLVIIEDTVAGDGTSGMYYAHDDGDGFTYWLQQGANAATQQHVHVAPTIAGILPSPSSDGYALLVVLGEVVPGDGTSGIYYARDDGNGLPYWVQHGAGGASQHQVYVAATIAAAPSSPSANGYVLLAVLNELTAGDETAGLYSARDDGLGNLYWEKVQ